MEIDRRLPKFIGDLKELLSTLLIYQKIVDIEKYADAYYAYAHNNLISGFWESNRSDLTLQCYA